jgi:hypothetical protein
VTSVDTAKAYASVNVLSRGAAANRLDGSWNTASAGPQIEIDPDHVSNTNPVLVGEYWSQIVTVTNHGDETLVVSEIGVREIECGPYGWLSTSVSTLTVEPGIENSQEFEVRVDASQYDLPARLYGEVYLKSNGSTDSLTMYVGIVLNDPNQVVHWDTVQTHPNMYNPYFPPEGECVGLAVSDHGAYGLPGWRDVHLDFHASGTECGSRDTDRIYLASGSPFVLINEGEGVSLTVSSYQSGIVKGYHWQPAPGSSGMEGGCWDPLFYDSVYTGQMVSRDGTIGLERVYYGPRANLCCIEHEFILVLTRVYSADGQPHSGVTVGSVTDWNVPSDEPHANTTGCSMAPCVNVPLVYVQGSDSTGTASCQPNASRFAAEVFIHGYSPRRLECGPHNEFWGVFAGPQALLRDTGVTRDGQPLDPPEPDAVAWREEIDGNPGCSYEPETGDQAIWLTYVHDKDLAVNDTLYFWTALLSVREGTLDDLIFKARVARVTCHEVLGWIYGCCAGMVGDANGLGGDEPTISDVSTLIDAKFIAGTCAGKTPCLREADINGSGCLDPNCNDITISDISTLIDYLFITGSSLGLPWCDEW